MNIPAKSIPQKPPNQNAANAPASAPISAVSTNGLPGPAGVGALTQAELAQQAQVAASYIWKLESGAAAPGIDMVDRLARSLGTTAHDLLPSTPPPETAALLKSQATKLFESLLVTADQPTLLMLCPLLARLAESPTRRR
jgi:transcriptional regulator with XRE-family HTH domain